MKPSYLGVLQEGGHGCLLQQDCLKLFIVPLGILDSKWIA